MAGGKEYQNDLMVGYSPERSPPLGMKEGEKTRVGLHPMEGTGFSGILSGMRTITRIFSRLPAQRLSMLYDSVAVVVMGGAFLFMVAFTECVGYVDGGGGGGAVVVSGPDLFLFGGGYDHGHDERGYSHRGYESRSAAHGHGGRR